MFALTIRESGKELGLFDVVTDVCRIGSRQPDGLQIEGLEPHALTVQQRDDGCHVFNRTNRILRLHRGRLLPGEKAIWKPGQVLKISPVELELSHSAELNGQSVDIDHSSNLASTPERSPIASLFEQRTPVMLLLALLSLVLILGSGSQDGARDLRFCQIVQKLHSAPHDSRLGLVKTNLQTAYDYQSRGANELAEQHYTTIQRILSSERSDHDALRFKPGIQRLEAETLNFVVHCLYHL